MCNQGAESTCYPASPNSVTWQIHTLIYLLTEEKNCEHVIQQCITYCMPHQFAPWKLPWTAHQAVSPFLITIWSLEKGHATKWKSKQAAQKTTLRHSKI